MPLPVVRPVEVWRLPEEDARAGRRAVGWTVGPGGELAVLLAHEKDLGPADGWPRIRTPFDGELVRVTDRGEWRLPLTPVTVGPDHLALLPGGRVLVVSYRSDDGSGTWEPNAVVFGAAGRPARELSLGDDVQALVTDRDGRIWMAFGDEGIYGDHPMAHPGLTAADTAGRVLWRPGPGELPGYPLEGLAAATEGRAAWLAWYPDSSGSYLTRIDPSGGPSSSVKCPVRQPVGFAISGRRGVFLTGRGEVVRCELVGEGWQETGRGRLQLPGGLDGERAHGRDGVLRFRAGDAWYEVAV
ncbi:hypothetical protein [Kitasatospora sp. NPDC058218]|uniref:hypothetical protein n=1 Tax=Kitasatospora sp. NPDC058218 TaxID=3346385 RepID=UPI0036D9379D